MSTIELRHTITEYLDHIDDASFLNAVKSIVEAKVAEGTYKLTDYQVKRVEEARAQFAKGETISNDLIRKEIDHWLSSK